MESDTKTFTQPDGPYNHSEIDYDQSSHDMFLNDSRYNDIHDRDSKMDQERDFEPITERSDISVDSIEKNSGDDRAFKRIQESWLDSLQKRNVQIVRVTYPRTANNDKELTVVRGEFLEVTKSFCLISQCDSSNF